MIQLEQGLFQLMASSAGAGDSSLTFNYQSRFMPFNSGSSILITGGWEALVKHL